MQKYIGVSASPGLSEVLGRTVSVKDALTKTIHENLTFLPRGAYPSDPSELLMGTYFKELMAELSQQYDAIVIDTAPVLLVTDAVIVGSIAANNYLVMGAGAHRPTEIEMVMKRLAGSSVVLQGSIFNFYKTESFVNSYGQYGKYGKYRYYNTYYYDDKLKA